MATCLPGSAGLLLTALVALAPVQTLAQSDYPNRVVRVIVPTATGGGNDTVGRVIAQGLTERWGKQVVVDNRAGASTMIGGEMVAKAPPDGYTLLMGVSTLAINPATFKKVPYEAMRDFAPITQAVFVPNLMMVHPSVPVKTVRQMIAFAKARPGQVLMASAGFGTNPHLSMELFASMGHIHMIHVPYKSSTPGIVDLIAGHVAIMAPNMLQSIPHVRAGRLRALGVTSATRSASAPDIPTIAEGGLPGYEAVQWYGLLAPAGTPADIIAKLHKETVAILRSPESEKRLAGDGAGVIASSPAEFAAFIKAETVKWAKVVKAAGIQPE
jgi:tripartite-type tricarboxylate transporter receptor subunit TctC